MSLDLSVLKRLSATPLTLLPFVAARSGQSGDEGGAHPPDQADAVAGDDP